MRDFDGNRMFEWSILRAHIDALDFAIKIDNPKAFLTAFRNEEWKLIQREWPEFVSLAIGLVGQ
jgi:hypothetical protein